MAKIMIRRRTFGYLLNDCPVGRVLCCAVLFVALLAVQSFPCAVQAQELRITVVDTQKVLKLSTAMTQVNEVIEQERDSLQKVFGAKEQKLVEQSRQLVAQRSVLDPLVFAQRKADIDKESAIVRRQAKEMKEKLNRLYAQSLEIVKAKMRKIIEKIVSEKEVDLLLDRRGTVFFRRDLEITNQIVSELNRQIPSVVVKADTVKE